MARGRIQTTIEKGQELTPTTVEKGRRADETPTLWWKKPRPPAGGASKEMDKPHEELFELVDRLITEQKPKKDKRK